MRLNQCLLLLSLTMAAVRAIRTQVVCSRTGAPWDSSAVVKAIVCDLDGTLLNSSKEVTERTFKAVEAARERGITFIPASGRSRPGIIAVLKDKFGEEITKSPMVTQNGLRVYGWDDEMLHESFITPEAAKMTVEYWREHVRDADITMLGSCGDGMVYEGADARARAYKNVERVEIKEMDDLVAAVEDGLKLNRLFFWGSSREAVQPFRPGLAELIGDAATLTSGLPNMIEVLPAGASKGHGLGHLLDNLSIDADQVMALGDEENDREMLASVGIGIAMGLDNKILKGHASHMTPSSDEDGVALAIEQIALEAVTLVMP
ncbi:unnamed protein product [Chrysoparadoxa australica]